MVADVVGETSNRRHTAAQRTTEDMATTPSDTCYTAFPGAAPCGHRVRVPATFTTVRRTKFRWAPRVVFLGAAVFAGCGCYNLAAALNLPFGVFMIIVGLLGFAAAYTRNFIGAALFGMFNVLMCIVSAVVLNQHRRVLLGGAPVYLAVGIINVCAAVLLPQQVDVRVQVPLEAVPIAPPQREVCAADAEGPRFDYCEAV